jgi:hypothetical protein
VDSDHGFVGSLSWPNLPGDYEVPGSDCHWDDPGICSTGGHYIPSEPEAVGQGLKN